MTSWHHKNSKSLATWTIVFMFASCHSIWAQTPPISTASIGPSQAISNDPDFAEAQKLVQQGKYEEAVSKLTDLGRKSLS
jgi:hypothetical protein